MLTVSIITLMMEEVSTPETSVNFKETTWRNIPNLKSRSFKVVFKWISVFCIET
jgi:hypothetical protein